MRDTRPKGEVTGYVTVALDGFEHWQGFFVGAASEAPGRSLLRDARDALRGAPAPPTQGGAAAEGGGAAETLRGLPDVRPEDQPLVGLLSAALVRLFAEGVSGAPVAPGRARALEDLIGGAAWALREVAGAPWLLVTGARDPGGRGWRTQVRRVEATDLDDARERTAAEIARLRQVQDIGEALVEDLINAAPRRRTT